jgi:diaminopimelate epimerase
MHASIHVFAQLAGSGAGQEGVFAHIITAAPMNTLANRPFVKMNGLGNEIVVVDLRAQPGIVAAAEARAAAARTGGVPYDQLMVLHAPRTPRTTAFVRIYNNDGSEASACGNGMRCVADLLFREPRQEQADASTLPLMLI